MSNYGGIWLQKLAAKQAQDLPAYAPHTIGSRLTEAEQHTYVLFHAAFLLMAGGLNADQQRLYQFWLPAINPAIQLGDIMQLAQQEQGELIELLMTLLDEHKLLPTLLVDLLIFSQFKTGLSEQQTQVLNELAHIQGMTQTEVDDVLQLCRLILGEQVTVEHSATILQLLENPCWQEFYAQTLDNNHSGNINGGIWRLSEDIRWLDRGLDISGAIILFNGKSLSMRNCETLWSKACLLTPKVSVTGGKHHLNQVQAYGYYLSSELVTAFKFNSCIDLLVCDSQFETVHARAFKFGEGCFLNGSTLDSSIFSKVTFKNCGCAELLGGSIYSYSHIGVSDSLFSHCIATMGGAVAVKYAGENMIVGCEFMNCYSINDSHFDVDGGAVYIEQASGCVFNECEIDTPVLVRELPDCDDRYEDRFILVANSMVETDIYYLNSQCGTSALDTASMHKSGWRSHNEKVINKPVPSWEECQA